MFIYTVALAGAIFTYICWYTFRPSRHKSLLAKIPGPTPIPLLGNALQLKPDTYEFFQQIIQYVDTYKNSSSFYKLMIGTLPIVIVYKAAASEKIIGSTKNLTKSSLYDFLQPWLNTGLLLSNGKKWHSRRKLLTPTFHFKILTDFLDVFNEQAETLVKRLSEKCDGASFDVFPFVTLCTLDIICETAMGKKINAQTSGGKSDYITAVNGISDILMSRVRSPWQWVDFIYKRTKQGRKHDSYLRTLHEFTEQVIEERIKEMENCKDVFSEDENNECTQKNGKQRRAFLELLLHMAKENNFTRHDIREEVDTFMFEGHDTTAAGISWALQLIGSHPEVQKKLHNEMDEVFGDSDRHVTTEDLAKMKYLECVIKESLRLLSPVPWVGREIEDDLEIDGVIIPKGVAVLVMIQQINRDPLHFPDPETFKPERFLPENSAGRHPFAFIPFSAGPRNCIGQRFALNEEKCVLSAIFRKYRIESTQTIKDIQPTPDVILRPRNGINIKLSQRIR